MNRPREFSAHLPKNLKDADLSEKGLHSLIDLIPTVAWRAQPNGSMEFINQRFYEYTGLSPKRHVAGVGKLSFIQKKKRGR